MRIAGLEKTSLVDWPGRLAAVVFTQGCNLDCFYCHNRDLLADHGALGRIRGEAALKWLGNRLGFLDGVVISGGEPTLNLDLADFIREVRAIGFPVKLDTNGTRPKVLRALVEERLLDYIAMDLKAPQDKYEAVVGVPVDHGAINASIDLLIDGRVDYEFRTTVVPLLMQADLVAIARRIRGARRYVLQQYRRPNRGPTAEPDLRLVDPPYSAQWVAEAVRALGAEVQSVETRGFSWSESYAATSAA